MTECRCFVNDLQFTNINNVFLCLYKVAKIRGPYRTQLTGEIRCFYVDTHTQKV